tara:strand:+ start:1573 stop:2811 length:1239 start_codon:yes stop_codon:yes gene_type:complete
MPKKVNTLYPIENDWKSLSATLRNKIDAGVIIAGESVQKYYDIEDMPAVLRDAADAMERGSKVIFIPQFETENFMQGFMYRPSRGQKIDAFYNRTFYPKHFANLFDSGYDPVLAGIGDILYDARNDEVVNFDARHRTVGNIAAREANQVPENQWFNCIMIKKDACKSIDAQKVACTYFRAKAETPKALTPEEKFATAVRSSDENALRVYAGLELSGLHIGNQYLTELQKEHHDPRKINGIWQLSKDYSTVKATSLNKNLTNAVELLRNSWNQNEGAEFSVYLVMGVCYLLQKRNVFGQQFPFVPAILVQALKWKNEQIGFTPKNYLSPRANGKAAESVAFHLLRVYNEYAQHLFESENEIVDEISISEFVKLPNDFLAQVGAPIEDDVQDEDYSDIEDALEDVGVEELETVQ